ncbi:platelet glycoprotein 4-like [Styela clava]
MSKSKQKNCCCTRECGLITAGIIGAILVILGGMLVFIFDTVYENIVKRESVIANNTDAYAAWSAPPPLYFELYVFNCTNPKEYLAGAENGTYVKPHFQELGPYVYKEFQKKDQMEFLDTEPEELRYRSTAKYYFEPSLSSGSEDDLVTTVNIIATAVPSIVEYWIETVPLNDTTARVLRRTVNKMINDAGSELLFTKTVGELLFGFHDELLSLIVNTIELLPIEGLPEGDLPETFGLFSTMNNSAGWYNYTIYTGKESYLLMNKLIAYNDIRELDFWFGEECNMINGTDGTTMPAFMNKDETMYIFVDDICRSMYAEFYEEVNIKGVPGWEYRIPRQLFEAPSTYEPNECWCPDLSLDVCQHSGGLPLSSCLYGAPIFMTSPHFLYAEYYLDFVEGLEPNEDDHATPLVYEPSTGICIRADKRLQINMYMMPFEHYDIMNKFPDMYYVFPILWLNESYIVSDDDAASMYRYLVQPGESFAITQIVFCIVGSVLVVAVIYFAAVMHFNKKNKGNDISSEDYEIKQEKTKYSPSNGNTYYDNGGMEMKEDVPEDKTEYRAYENVEKDVPVTQL